MSAFTNMLKIMRLPKGMRGTLRKINPKADDIVYPAYTKYKGMNSSQAIRMLEDADDIFPDYSALYRMPIHRVASMFHSGAPIRRSTSKVPMVRDINGQKVPDINGLGYSPYRDRPYDLKIPFQYTPPTGSKLIDYTTPLSPKGMAIPLQQKALHSRMRAAGTVRPIEWANAEAGDPEYANKAYSAIKQYLENPANGFKKTLNDIPGTGYIYVHPTIGTKAHPELLWSQMNRRAGYVQFKGFQDAGIAPDEKLSYVSQYGKPEPFVRGSYIYHYNDPMLDPNNSDFKYVRNSSPTIGLSSGVDAYTMYKNKLRPANRIALYDAQGVGHEVNHLGTIEYLSNEVLPGQHGGGIDYHVSMTELGQAASHFKRQYFRNTGKLIDHHDKVEDAIAYARAHMEDFDPESRRFLMSVDHLIDEINGRKSLYDRTRAYSTYERLKRGIPLLFGGAVAAPMAMQGGEQQ